MALHAVAVLTTVGEIQQSAFVKRHTATRFNHRGIPGDRRAGHGESVATSKALVEVEGGITEMVEHPSTVGIQANHPPKLQVQLTALDSARRPEDMSAPSWKLHPLKGYLRGHWAITVNGNWRLTFAFDEEDAILVDYQDYH